MVDLKSLATFFGQPVPIKLTFRFCAFKCFYAMNWKDPRTIRTSSDETWRINLVKGGFSFVVRSISKTHRP